MAISFTNYVDITSGVGAGVNVPTRNLITRIFTPNIFVNSNGTPVTFTNANDVGVYFGTTSEEYLRALFYFSWISKNTLSPQSISYAYYTPVNISPVIVGAYLNLLSPATTLATLQAVTNGTLVLTLGATTNTITAVNLSTATSLTQVASMIQSAINAQSGGTMWSLALVLYQSSNGRSSFVFSGGNASSPAVAVVGTAMSGTDLAPLLGWANTGLQYPAGPVVSNGIAAQTPDVALTNSTTISDNFGSFLFTNSSDITTSEITVAATWNAAQYQLFMYLVAVTASNFSTVSTNLASISGSIMTLTPALTPVEYPEMVPGMIEAATNYLGINSVQNYMFQQFDLTPSVTDDTDATTYNNASVNYYGETQTAGQQLSFYQLGVMTGGSVSTDITDPGVYANEAWLKSAAGAIIMSLLLATPYVPANTRGASQIVAVLQSVIDQALLNGTISVGGFLTSVQKLYITDITGDPNAWQQVQSSGYWVNCVIESYVVGPNTFYKAVYTLVYKKNDVIRMVQGSHTLI